MAQILNLAKARKARRRAAEQAQADQNAVKHGRTRAERESEDAERQRLESQLDGARLVPALPAEDDDPAP